MDGSLNGKWVFHDVRWTKIQSRKPCRAIVKMTRARKGISIRIKLFVVQRFVSPFVPLLANAGDTECVRRQMSLPPSALHTRRRNLPHLISLSPRTWRKSTPDKLHNVLQLSIALLQELGQRSLAEIGGLVWRLMLLDNLGDQSQLGCRKSYETILLQIPASLQWDSQV